ncbi:MAG: hypothetical protein ABJC89_24260, partial [Acidobacteriota bacterium]
MPPHVPHLIGGIVALAAAIAVASLTVNRLVRRKLRVSIVLLGAYVALQILRIELPPGLQVQGTNWGQLLSFENLAFAGGIITLLVVALLNPLRVDRVPDRFPNILQDFIIIGLVVLVATFVFKDTLLTTSAVSAVVLGFALQETL